MPDRILNTQCYTSNLFNKSYNAAKFQSKTKKEVRFSMAAKALLLIMPYDSNW